MLFQALNLSGHILITLLVTLTRAAQRRSRMSSMPRVIVMMLWWMSSGCLLVNNWSQASTAEVTRLTQDAVGQQCGLGAGQGQEGPSGVQVGQAQGVQAELRTVPGKDIVVEGLAGSTTILKL